MFTYTSTLPLFLSFIIPFIGFIVVPLSWAGPTASQTSVCLRYPPSNLLYHLCTGTSKALWFVLTSLCKVCVASGAVLTVNSTLVVLCFDYPPALLLVVLDSLCQLQMAKYLSLVLGPSTGK